MVVLVGSTRPAKVEGARAAILDIGVRDPRFRFASVLSRDVADVAPRMPMTEAEVIAGARERAAALVSGVSGGVLCLGLEGGLDRVTLPGGNAAHVLRSWACATDGARWGFGAGPALAVPARVAAEVEAGAELGDVIDRQAGSAVRGSRGAWGVLTLDLIDRREAFRLAVIAALAPFYNPVPYEP
jgi:inosine/xanthosine triphosphatase